MNFTFGKWCYSPKLLTSLLTVVFFGLFVSLGVWQLNRADYKRELNTEFQQKLAEPAVDFGELDLEGDIESLSWRRVFVNGQFVNSKNVYLDNQVVKGVAGYFVYTPIELKYTDRWLLVNRGWVSVGVDRSVVPKSVAVAGEVRVKGLLKGPPKTGVLLKNVEPEKLSEDIYRVQKIDLDNLEKLFNKNLFPVILRLDENSEHGFTREWHMPGSGEAVHQGYAFQWFAFAATLLIIYIVLNVKKIEQ